MRLAECSMLEGFRFDSTLFCLSLIRLYFKLVNRMHLKRLTSEIIVYALRNLYPVGILTQLDLTSLSMYFVTL